MNSVNHFEIPADNVERAKIFYSKVFGWKLNDIPEMKYTIVHTTETDEKGMIKNFKGMGVVNGGMMKRSSQVRSPVITISVENIEEAIVRVENNGGKKVVDKMKVGEMGFSAYVRDSEGNVIGLWQPTGKM